MNRQPGKGITLENVNIKISNKKEILNQSPNKRT